VIIGVGVEVGYNIPETLRAKTAQTLNAICTAVLGPANLQFTSWGDLYIKHPALDPKSGKRSFPAAFK
jgi:hypothetical protein